MDHFLIFKDNLLELDETLTLRIMKEISNVE